MIRIRLVELPLLGSAALAETESGLCLAAPGNLEETAARLRRGRPGTAVVPDPGACEEAARQLEEFLAGRRDRFQLTLDPGGTPFQREVWDALLAIPKGAVRSYAEIARAIGRPTASRAVGAAVGANPLCVIIPCHRVIGSDGSLTGFAYGLSLKKRLLELESTARGATL